MATDHHAANEKRVEDLAAELFREPDRVTIDEERRSMLKRQREELLAERRREAVPTREEE